MVLFNGTGFTGSHIRGSGERGNANAGAHLCRFLCKHSVCVCVFPPHFHTQSPRRVSGAASPHRVSLQERLIYEPGANAAPILLHNVTIKDSRHRCLARHLAPAYGTPGEAARVAMERRQRSTLSHHQL